MFARPFCFDGGVSHVRRVFADDGIGCLVAAGILAQELAVDDLETGFDGEHERRGAVAEMAERRQHKRYAVDAMAEVLVLDGTLLFRGRVLDISVAGCYIETQARLRMRQRTPVEIVFRVKDVVFRLEATSRMIRPGRGVGFLFADLSGRMQEELETLIAQLSLPGAAE